VEARLVEALAAVGLGRVLLRREVWEEALAAHQDHLARLKEADDPAAQALAYVGMGEAQRHLGRLAEAREAFVTGARLYATAEAAIGEAAAAQGEGRVLAERGELEAADGRYAHAVELSERVGRALADEADRHAFFDGRALLYAEAILVAARREGAGRSTQLATSYAGLAGSTGRAVVARRLREDESGLPVRGEQLSEDDILRNRAAARLLAGARAIVG
jgi:tetratricopeptide (TPR) repeat protein